MNLLFLQHSSVLAEAQPGHMGRCLAVAVYYMVTYYAQEVMDLADSLYEWLSANAEVEKRRGGLFQTGGVTGAMLGNQVSRYNP